MSDIEESTDDTKKKEEKEERANDAEKKEEKVDGSEENLWRRYMDLYVSKNSSPNRTRYFEKKILEMK